MNDPIKQLVENRTLSPRNQRVLWARVTTIKRVLTRAGLTTHEEFEEMTAAMLRDIDAKIEKNIRETIGADDVAGADDQERREAGSGGNDPL